MEALRFKTRDGREVIQHDRGGRIVNVKVCGQTSERLAELPVQQIFERQIRRSETIHPHPFKEKIAQAVKTIVPSRIV